MLITAGHYTCLLPNIPMSASIGPFVSQVFVTISTFPVAGRQWYHGIPQHLGMDQYLLIPFLVGWTFIYQLFWCSPGVQGFDTLQYPMISQSYPHLKKTIIGTSELPCCKTSIFFSFPRPPRAEGCRDVPRRILRNVGRWTRCSFTHSVLKLAGQVRRSSIPQSGVPWQASHNLLRGTM